MSKAIAYIGLGANLGDPAKTLCTALDELSSLSAVTQCVSSDFLSTAPVGAPGPIYVNAVARLQTTLAPLDLLAELQRIEQRHGRLRAFKNAPRTLDLDLLWYDGLTVHTPTLTLPHPRMHLRAFVLLPLKQLVGEAFELLGQPLDFWLENCTDQHCETHPKRWSVLK